MEMRRPIFVIFMIGFCGTVAYGTGNQGLSLPYTCTTTTRLCQPGESSENHLLLDPGSTVQHGRPGKRGIRGPKGEKGDSCGCDVHRSNNLLPRPTAGEPVALKGTKGDKGEPGRSESASEELQEMRTRIEKLEADILKGQRAKSVTTEQDERQDSVRLLSPFPKSCSELRMKKGSNLDRAVIYPFLSFYDINPIKVNCSDGAGWITIQRRSRGYESFYRTWRDYTEGFGNKDGEFWLGLKYIHRLTSQHPYELYIEFKRRDNAASLFAKYGVFYIGNEASKFRLIAGDYSGNYADYLQHSNGLRFSTYDQDFDETSSNCAQLRKGAWWYTNCGNINLNGQYSGTYFAWGSYVLSSSEMKIRPRC